MALTCSKTCQLTARSTLVHEGGDEARDVGGLHLVVGVGARGAHLVRPRGRARRGRPAAGDPAGGASGACPRRCPGWSSPSRRRAAMLVLVGLAPARVVAGGQGVVGHGHCGALTPRPRTKPMTNHTPAMFAETGSIIDSKLTRIAASSNACAVRSDGSRRHRVAAVQSIVTYAALMSRNAANPPLTRLLRKKLCTGKCARSRKGGNQTGAP